MSVLSTLNSISINWKLSIFWIVITSLTYIYNKKADPEAEKPNKKRLRWLRICFFLRMFIYFIKSLAHALKGTDRREGHIHFSHPLYKWLMGYLNLALLVNDCRPQFPMNDHSNENTEELHDIDYIALCMYCVGALIAVIIICTHIFVNVKEQKPKCLYNIVNKLTEDPEKRVRWKMKLYEIIQDAIWRPYVCSVWASQIGELLLNGIPEWYLPNVVVFTVLFVLNAEKWPDLGFGPIRNWIMIGFELYLYMHCKNKRTVSEYKSRSFSKFLNSVGFYPYRIFHIFD
eukprot:246482_1